MHGLALIGIYLAVALAGQVIGYGMSSLVERTVPWAGMPVFLAIFFGMPASDEQTAALAP